MTIDTQNVVNVQSNVNRNNTLKANAGNDTGNIVLKKDGEAKLGKALLCLGAAAAAGVGLYVAGKNGKLDKLKTVLSSARDSILKNKKGNFNIQNGIKEKVENLPLFNSKNIVEGVYRDSSGNRIIVDKFGTGIVDFGNGVFQVTRTGVSKVYDANNLQKINIVKDVADAAKNTEVKNLISNIQVQNAEKSEILAQNIKKQALESLQPKSLAQSAKVQSQALDTIQSQALTKNAVAAAKNTAQSIQTNNKITTISEIRLNAARKLLDEFKKNPTRKNYNALVKITHPDTNGFLEKDVANALADIFKQLPKRPAA